MALLSTKNIIFMIVSERVIDTITMVLMPGFQSTRLVTEGTLEPFFFLYADDSIQGNPETCKQSSVMLNYEVKNTAVLRRR